jgi:hypothetical protein
MAKSDGQAVRVQAPAAYVGGQSEAPRSAKVHPVHTGEVVTGEPCRTRSGPRSLRRHEIGDSLYDLFTDADGQIPDRVIMYPVAKVTERYVWVRGGWFYDEDRTYRFSRADLESKGYAFNRANRLMLHAAPMLDWPPLVVSVSGPRELEG